jgi:chondroitin-sulfate-ABC endolyase/exolyase
MKNLKLVQNIIFCLALSLPMWGNAQVTRNERFFSFEKGDALSMIHGEHSTWGLSTIHYKDGKSSMKWDFDSHSSLSIRKNLLFEKKDPTGKDLYQSLFVVWVYNEKPLNDSITFQFLKDGKLCCSFPMHIHFKGWRAAWVIYERDMQGKPEEGMNELRILAPSQKGSLYFDHLITSIKADQRQQSPDLQVPFVNAKTDSHWLMIYKNSQRSLPEYHMPVTESQKQEIRTIEQRFEKDLYKPSKLTEQKMDNLRKKYSFYGITYDKNGQITGVPLFFTRNSECFERMIPHWDKDMYDHAGVNLRKYFDLMQGVAVAYHDATNSDWKNELKEMYLSLYRHATDQGIAYGSCLGTIHHYGYSFRGFYTSYFLMKDVLKDAGYLQDAENAMNWYAQTKAVFERPNINGMDIDTFNTATEGRMASILMMPDSPEKVQYLQAYSGWLNIGLYPAPGLKGSFKSDGAIFHHCNCYPAYAVGGLEGATKMVYYLSHTSFAVDELAHTTLKNSLLAMRFYCNKEHYPLALSGRHPDGLGKLSAIHYLRMAFSGTPDKKDAVDKEMAAAYLRFASDTDDHSNNPEYMPTTRDKRYIGMMRELQGKGYQPESDPQGNLAIGYGCFSVQRRDNWSAVVRGHSRYLWAAEHYLGANLYGRYLSHGSLQIMTAPKGQMVTPLTSGWQEEGFDWRRVPGATAICLPFEQLHAKILNVDTFSGIEEMLYSDEAFAGGLSQEKMNGNFGMKLHEHDKYNGSHRARKSFHFFDGEIVCLGSDIENTNTSYPTETTLFQQVVNGDNEMSYWNHPVMGENYMMDSHATGYYYPRTLRSKIVFEKNFPQESRNQETEKIEKANWVVMTCNHGKAPKGESYEYAVLPGTNEQILKERAAKPDYIVLCQNRAAHIVKCKDMTSYVLFETPLAFPQGLLLKTDTACLVMVKQNKQENVVTVCNPDLALYRGKSDDVYDKDGKRIERSIYSRPWINHESLEVPVTITLKGKWNFDENEYVSKISSDIRQTVIRIRCREGRSYDILLRK